MAAGADMTTHRNGFEPLSSRPLVVISYYDRRPTDCLRALLHSMAAMPAGMAFDALIVANTTRDELPVMPHAPFPLSVLRRENTGMNIGAWDAGWRAFPGRKAYVFLQDECLIVREGWLKGLVDRSLGHDVGLVGESSNPAWEAPWTRLKAIHAASKLPDHYIDGRPAARVDTYLHHITRWGIDPGATGAHQRSLTWGMRGEVLQAIDGFPIGADYGECIAAEIAVSRKIAAEGLRVVQARQAPFHFVRHREWNQDVPGSAFNHASKASSATASWESPARADLDAEADRIRLFLGDPANSTDESSTAVMISALLRKLEDRERRIVGLLALQGGAEKRTAKTAGPGR
jgi:hypothetical protein